jgi:ATP-dependent helicase/nuclease subunit B
LSEAKVVTPIAMPKPRPPVSPCARKQLSVTRIEKLIRDPYAIYARHVLRLEPLEPDCGRT